MRKSDDSFKQKKQDKDTKGTDHEKLIRVLFPLGIFGLLFLTASYLAPLLTESMDEQTKEIQSMSEEEYTHYIIDHTVDLIILSILVALLSSLIIINFSGGFGHVV